MPLMVCYQQSRLRSATAAVLWIAPHCLTDPPSYHINQTKPMKIEVRYQTPYSSQEWRSQWFPTLAEAERMVDFYRSCGSPAHVAPSSLAQFEHLGRS